MKGPKEECRENAICVVLPGCGLTPSEPEAIIKDFRFDPDPCIIEKGSSLKWINQDSINHQILFDSGPLIAASRTIERNLVRSASSGMPGTSPGPAQPIMQAWRLGIGLSNQMVCFGN
jgi:hypothetical protein